MTDTATVSVQIGAGLPMPLSRDYKATVTGTVEPNSYRWFLIR